MRIGAQQGNIQYLGGGIADVRIYNRALSEGEINELAQNERVVIEFERLEPALDRHLALVEVPGERLASARVARSNLGECIHSTDGRHLPTTARLHTHSNSGPLAPRLDAFSVTMRWVASS